MKRLRFKLTPKTKRFLVFVVLAASIAGVLTWHFKTIPTGISSLESESLELVQSSRVTDPDLITHLPYYLILKALMHWTDYSLFAARALSLVFSVTGLVAFYKLTRLWWSRLVAVAATFLLGTSFWFLFTSRLIGPQSLALLWFCSLLLFFHHLKHEAKWWHMLLAGAITGFSLYIPPLMGWVALGLTAAIFRHSLRVGRGRDLLSRWLLFFASFTVSVGPLVIASIQEPTILLSTFGLNAFHAPSEAVLEIHRLLKIFWWDSGLQPLLLKGVGLIDVIIGSLGLFGLLKTITTWRLQRSQVLLASALLAGLLSVISSSVFYLALGFLLPVAFIFVARGLNQYHSEWRRRFPRNPTAKVAGLMAVCSLVLLSVIYNLRTYYVVWAGSEAVQSQFELATME